MAKCPYCKKEIKHKVEFKSDNGAYLDSFVLEVPNMLIKTPAMVCLDCGGIFIPYEKREKFRKILEAEKNG